MAENRDRRNDRNREENDGLNKKLIAVNRVTKTVKGGKNMRFSALVVVGDGNGKIGLGMGKAAEVPEAIEKATQSAKRNLVTVSLKGNTLCAASTVEKDIAAKVAELSKSDAAKVVGAAIAEKAQALGIKEVVFDRGGYLYTGRVQALADGAREAGLEF